MKTKKKKTQTRHYKEIVRVPKCLVESSPMFYAGSILGLNTLGCMVWRRLPDGKIRKFWLTFVSRIADKSAAFTVVLLQRLIAECRASGDLEHISRVQIISDTGTHFRSYTVLATISHEMLQSLRPAIVEMNVFFLWGRGSLQEPMRWTFQRASRSTSASQFGQ